MNIDVNNIQYGISGGAFLAVAAYGIRFIYKLQVSGESIYERRSDRQVATIKDLEEYGVRMRKEMAECHKERLELSSQVAAQKIEINEQKVEIHQQKLQLQLLEEKVKKLQENI